MQSLIRPIFEKRLKIFQEYYDLVSAILIIIFLYIFIHQQVWCLVVYFLNLPLHLDYKLGLFITGGVVVAYTLFGGFLAVSLTDFVQGIIMFLALVLVPIVAFTDVGGIQPTFDVIREIDPTLLDFFKGTTVIGIISLLAWGLGYFGQPHIIVRFMAITSVKELKPARRIGMSWMIISIIGEYLYVLLNCVVINQLLHLEDPETIFIMFSNYYSIHFLPVFYFQ